MYPDIPFIEYFYQRSIPKPKWLYKQLDDKSECKISYFLTQVS